MFPTGRRRVLVCGAGGFIGSHLARRLTRDGHHVVGVDLRFPEFSAPDVESFVLADLRDQQAARAVFELGYNEVYQLAADMGGAGFVFSGSNDAQIMHNSALVNLNVLRACVDFAVPRVFFSSSACIYPAYLQQDPAHPECAEDSAYPAAPDSEYGWEKLFAERVYAAFARNHTLEVRIGRFHNVFGPEGTWRGGREKAPAAICRKVAEAPDGGTLEIWGDGAQTRTFLYIDECIEAVCRLMASHVSEPVNIGSDEMVSIEQLARMTMQIAGKQLDMRFVEGPQGVRGRTSDNRRIQRELGWQPSFPLRVGLERTYEWVAQQVTARAAAV